MNAESGIEGALTCLVMPRRWFIFLLTIAFTSTTTMAVAAETSQVSLEVTLPDLQNCCVRIRSATDRSSGVVISHHGHILTVAHGIAETAEHVTVITSAGRKLTAVVVRQNRDADVALLKLQESDVREVDDIRPLRLVGEDWYRMPGWQGMAVLSLGYPAREPRSTRPVCRLGRLTAAGKKHLRTSCALTAGDSGGPVITLSGRLLGIHQKIGVGRQSNLHLSVQACRQGLRDSLEQAGIDPGGPLLTEEERASAQMLLPSTVVLEQIRRHAINVLDATSGQKLAHGTLMAQGLAVTKLSRLPPSAELIVETCSGLQQRAEISGTAQSLDLAYLRILRDANTGESFPEIKSLLSAEGAPAETSVAAGGIIFTGSESTVGIIARTQHNEGRVDPTIGCTLVEQGDEVMVEAIAPDSASAEAGLQPHDQLLRLAGTQIRTLSDVGAALGGWQPGDRITFTCRRGQTIVNTTGQLRYPASQILDRAEFLDGRAGILSRRRTGFSNVLQHDAPIEADEMGGPLFTADGRLVGVNIARRARESVLAVPLSTIFKLHPASSERSE